RLRDQIALVRVGRRGNAERPGGLRRGARLERGVVGGDVGAGNRRRHRAAGGLVLFLRGVEAVALLEDRERLGVALGGQLEAAQLLAELLLEVVHLLLGVVEAALRVGDALG